ncbi:TMEM43 family protein [Mesorhizobium sp. ANAO-SY3R2]|uniref:TMEM43 family protein n=1 Tax=Mesorhizobium sp. ANAO-SY3R2 TaxID=3166644 RepID=UPI00366EFD6F
MGDQFQEVTSVSWFGRIKRAVGGVLVGLILVVAMVVVLFWNEGRAVTTSRSLAEGASIVASVSADSVDPANDGKLVHVSGPVKASEGLVDEDFAIAAEGVRLVREVEMYQWVEHSKSETQTKLGGSEETVTTYSYAKEWQDRAIDSSEFKQPANHENPSMEIEGTSFQIAEGSLGAFTLDEEVLNLIGNSQKLAVKPNQIAAIEAAFAGSERVSVADGRIFLGANASSPAIGDYRIGYSLVPLGDISIVGEQSGSGFTAYQTVAGDQLLMVDSGKVSAADMFAEAVRGNTILTWLLRAGCLLLLALGFGLLLGPLGVLADVIPFLGSIVRMGTGLVAFVLALLVGTVTIAFAWFWYRPLLAIGILVAGLALTFALTRIGKRKAVAAAPQAGATA